jgi:DNA-directed RNA polymerase
VALRLIACGSPWNINTHTFRSACCPSQPVAPDDPAEAIRVAEHKRLATETFYLPTTMDFRGRIYYRTPWVSPQSGDLGKALLCFPPTGQPGGIPMSEGGRPSSCTSPGSMGLDKKPYPSGLAWFKGWDWSVEGADKPLTLLLGGL